MKSVNMVIIHSHNSKSDQS